MPVVPLTLAHDGREIRTLVSELESAIDENERIDENPTLVDGRTLCDPESGDVIRAIHDHYHDRDPNDRNHVYVLTGDEWTVSSGCTDSVWDEDGAEEYRSVHHEEPIWFPEHRFFAVVSNGLVDLRVTSPDVDLLWNIGKRNASVPNAQRTHLKGFRIDIREDGVDCGVAVVHNYRRALLEDITLWGQRDRAGEHGGSRYGLKVDCLTESARAQITRVRQPSGDTHHVDDDQVGHAIPFSSEPTHEG